MFKIMIHLDFAFDQSSEIRILNRGFLHCGLFKTIKILFTYYIVTTWCIGASKMLDYYVNISFFHHIIFHYFALVVCFKTSLIKLLKKFNHIL